jgi:hypothetical protein
MVVGNRKALLFGINYIGSKYELNGCINDTISLKNKLKLLGFNDIITLTDDNNYKPTKNNMLLEIKKFLESSNENDILFIAYSGHGSNILDISGDEQDGLDEMIIPCDLDPITDDTLKNYISKYIKKNVTLFGLFDCCHSGSILDLKYQYLDSNNYDRFIINKKDYVINNNNILIISGCMDKQTSADAYINRKYQGAMTWSFLQTLEKYPNINLKDLLIYMRKILKDNNYDQIPQMSSNIEINIMKNCFLKNII